MGRRSKSELYGLIERIFKLYTQENKTMQQIEETLRDEGYDISREAIRRSVKESKEMAIELKKSLEEARVIIDAVRENPNTDMVEATVAHLGGLLFRETSSFESIHFDEPMQAVQAAGKLADAQTKIARLRLSYQKGVQAAKSAVLSALRKELDNHPDILDRLQNLVQDLKVDE